MATDTGILSPGQRKTLQGGSKRDDTERRRVRERVRNALARDALVLWETLQPDEVRRIFRSTDREPNERTESTAEDRKTTDENREADRQEVDEECQEVDEERQEAVNVEPGAAALLAFVYLGLEERDSDRRTDDFEAVLGNAMERVARRNGWLLDEFEFTVEFDRDPDDEKLRRRFDDGTATIEEATELLRRDVITSAEYAGYAQTR